MSRFALTYVWLPIASAVAYFTWLALDAETFAAIFFTERGLIEMGTAAFFFLAAAVGGSLLGRNASALPRTYRVVVLAFVLAAAFVTLEEVSWGQHLLGWRTPDWFRARNANRETNLHNLMGNRPSRRFRLVAYIGFPAVAIVLPLALRGRRRRGHWSGDLAPGFELAVLAVVCLAANVPNKVPEWIIGPPVRGPHLREIQELYMGWAAFLWISGVRRKLLPTAGVTALDPTAHAAITATPPIIPASERRFRL